jgi:replicative DNA helicase
MNKQEQKNNLYNTEAEQSILGAMILNNDCVSIATKTLRTEEFFHEQQVV